MACNFEICVNAPTGESCVFPVLDPSITVREFKLEVARYLGIPDYQQTLITSCPRPSGYRELYDFEALGIALPAVATTWPVQVAVQRRSAELEHWLVRVQSDGHSLQHARDYIRADREVILNAVRNSGTSLQYASAHLKADREVVLTAIAEAGASMVYASPDLRSDHDFVLLAAQLNIGVLICAAEALRDDPNLILKALTLSGAAMRCASTRLQGDRNFALQAVEVNGGALAGVAEELRADPEVALAAVRSDRYSLAHAAIALRASCEFMALAVKVNPYSLTFALEDVVSDREIVTLAVQKQGAMLQFAAPELRGDEEVALAAVTSDGMALEHASPSMRKNRRVVEAAVQQNGLAFGFADEDLRSDPVFAYDMIKESRQCVAFTTPELRHHYAFVEAAARRTVLKRMRGPSRTSPEIMEALLALQEQKRQRRRKAILDHFNRTVLTARCVQKFAKALIRAWNRRKVQKKRAEQRKQKAAIVANATRRSRKPRHSTEQKRQRQSQQAEAPPNIPVLDTFVEEQEPQEVELAPSPPTTPVFEEPVQQEEPQEKEPEKKDDEPEEVDSSTNQQAEGTTDDDRGGSADQTVAKDAGKTKRGSGGRTRKRESQAHQADFFTKMAVDGVVPVDRLNRVLVLMGYKFPNVEWVQEIIDEFFDGRSFLDRDDFAQFTVAYKQRYQIWVSESFMAADADQSGLVGISELAPLLMKSGITPFPQVLHELVEEVGGLDTEEIDLEQYEHIQDILRERSGFTLRETERLDAAFKRCSKRTPGQLTLSELKVALISLGFEIDKDTADVLSSRNSKGFISHSQFLSICREYREQQIKDVLIATGIPDATYETMLRVDSIMTILETMGKDTASPEVMKEILVSMELLAQEEISVEDTCDVIQRFHELEGFPAAEYAEILDSFRRFDPGKGTIADVELEGAIKWLGFYVSLEDVQDLVADFDLDSSDELDFHEFLKLIGRLHTARIRQLRTVFNFLDRDFQNAISPEKFQKALEHFGYASTEHRTARFQRKLNEVGVMGFWELASFMAEMWQEERTRFRENYMFSDFEIHRLELLFADYDTAGNGYINKKSLAELLAAICPRATRIKAEYNEIRSLLYTADSNHDGTINFKEFLYMMRLTLNRQEHERVRQERLAAEEGKFSRDEVAEFRHLFRQTDLQFSGLITFDGFCELLHRILPMGDAVTKELKLLVDDVNGDILDHERELSFATFLRALRKVMDVDFRGINTAARAIATALEGSASESESIDEWTWQEVSASLPSSPLGATLTGRL